MFYLLAFSNFLFDSLAATRLIKTESDSVEFDQIPITADNILMVHIVIQYWILKPLTYESPNNSVLLGKLTGTTVTSAFLTKDK